MQAKTHVRDSSTVLLISVAEEKQPHTRETDLSIGASQDSWDVHPQLLAGLSLPEVGNRTGSGHKAAIQGMANVT